MSADACGGAPAPPEDRAEEIRADWSKVRLHTEFADAHKDIKWLLSALSAARTRVTDAEAERDLSLQNFASAMNDRAVHVAAARREALEEAAQIVDEAAAVTRYDGLLLKGREAAVAHMAEGTIRRAARAVRALASSAPDPEASST